MIAALRHRPFALLWAGQSISRLGDSLYRIALSWWVLEKTGSAAVMGTVLIFSFAPMLIFSLIGGVAVDRFSRPRVMLFSDLVRGALTLGVAGLVITGQLEIWHVYTASIVFGLVSAFFQPAYTAVMPEITPSELLPGANSLTSLSAQVASIAGPALGALLVKAGGTGLGFALDGVSFLVAAACLVPLQFVVQAARPGMAGLNVWGELRVGLRAVLASPWLWVTIAIAALINVTISGPMSVSLPFLVSGTMGRDVNALGLLYSFSSAGAVVGAVLLGRYKRLRRRGLLAYGAWIGTGLAVAAFGLPLPYEVMLGFALLFGLTLMVFGLVWTNTLQEMVPGDLLGRVASIDNIGSFVLLPVGYGLAGIMTDALGAPTVFLVGGILTMLITALAMFHPSIRQLD